MKRFILGILMIVCLTLFSLGNKANAMGLFYTNASYPLTATGTKITDLSNLKSGKSDCLNVLWFVEVGDAGIEKAMKDGQIKKVSFIDINEKTVFIFFRKITTTVYGE